jgi:rubrerythrin
MDVSRKEVAMNIFDCAIRMEEDASAYYRKLSEEVKIPEIKNLLSLLADAEKEHRDALVDMRDKLDTKKEEFAVLKDAACAFRPLLGKRNIIEGLKNDPDAYKQVVKREEEDVRFYEDLAAKAESEDARRLLRKIADEERRHLSIVENIYAFVESPRTYLAWGEFSNLEEY